MRLVLAAAVILAFASACLEGGAAGTGAGVGVCTSADTVRILNGPDSVAVGATKQLSFTTSAASINCLRWSSSNDFIARVSSGGIVQGLAVGRVTIRAIAAARSDSIPFSVVTPPTK